MKVVVDAYNLGLLQGTGIATYARELCCVLSNSGHEVYPLYGLRKVDASDVNAWAQFLQRLSIYGEETSRHHLLMDFDFWLGLVKASYRCPCL